MCSTSLITAMIAEFDLRCAACASLRAGRRPLRSVYLGGGTPSLLEVAEMSRLLAGTARRLPAVTDCEVTAEANLAVNNTGDFHQLVAVIFDGQGGNSSTNAGRERAFVAAH